MNILLVYQIVPETCRFYSFENLDEETSMFLKSCHGQYGNMVGCDSDLMDRLSTFLDVHKDKMIYCDEVGSEKNDSRKELLISAQTLLIVSGFIVV